MLNYKFIHTNRRAFCLLLALITLNIAAWILALRFFSHYPTLFASAFLAYGFGLRHAVDADHIAAIDNVTRKLMQQGQVPIGVGAFFSLGHSSIVILACAAIAATSMAFQTQMGWLHDYGSIIGTLVSALFLLTMALFNVLIFRGVFKRFRQIKKGESLQESDLRALENVTPTGIMGWMYRFAFKFVTQSWQMYLIGFLFGLGFDTATEVGLLGISASGVHSGLSVWSIMIFPLLFASGMALIDSLDNFVMIGAYGWAFKHPIRKLYYNMTITMASALVALFIGGLEALSLLADQFHLQGGIWDFIGNLSENMGMVGYSVIALFIFFWMASTLYYRFKNYDHLEIQAIKKG
ncbi:HoxN/HupN/NixA family nickel/cobalt transporter [Acetobacteraceae bacterium]|nr:HoxN/HupN/NixA family nickel/cobalt transporter [Acetobacteraceae bacterium]